MSHRFYPMALHRNEWERLKKQGRAVVPETRADPRAKYFEALNEQSKKWINLWPDSAESFREKEKQLRRKERKENRAFINAFRKSSNHESGQAAVKRAKQIIFDDSCYGRQLISAINTSNIIEEREAQIEFRKEIMQKEAGLEKNKIYGDSPLVSDVDGEEKKANRKLAALECVKFNEEIELMKKKKTAQLRAEKIICESVDEDMVKQVKEVEAKKKAELKQSVKKGIEEYEEERKEMKKHRQKNKDRDNALINVYNKEQDRTRCKVDTVFRKIIEENRHSERAVKFYKVIDEIQKAEKKRYEDFIEKGIEMHEQRYAHQKAVETEIENKKRAEQYKISEDNKVAAEQHKLYLKDTAPGNKSACHVQTLLTKPDTAKKPVKKSDAEVKDSKRDGQDGFGKSIEKEDSKDKLSFLKPRSTLVKALRRREKESSGYTGVEGADKYFGEQASDALQRTKHKYFARKVVDEYLKVNCLDPSDLSISNY